MSRIETARMVLRKPRLSDAGDLHEAMSDPRAMRYWSRPAHTELAETEAYLQKMLGTEATGGDDYVIEVEGRVMGKAGMWRVPEIGFLLHPALWGQGYAREALEALIPYLFTTHGLTHLTAEADPRNDASLGLLIRFGFRETHREKNTLLWGDEWCDSVYLRLDRSLA